MFDRSLSSNYCWAMASIARLDLQGVLDSDGHSTSKVKKNTKKIHPNKMISQVEAFETI